MMSWMCLFSWGRCRGEWATRTIGTLAHQRAPSALRHLDQPHLNLHLSNGEVALVEVDLTLEGLEDEGLVAMGVGKLCAPHRGLVFGGGKGDRPGACGRTLRGSKEILTCSGSAPLSKIESVSFSSVS